MRRGVNKIFIFKHIVEKGEETKDICKFYRLGEGV